MDDTGGVRFGESLRNLAREIERAFERNRTGVQDVAQGLPVHELHREPAVSPSRPTS